MRQRWKTWANAERRANDDLSNPHLHNGKNGGARDRNGDSKLATSFWIPSVRCDASVGSLGRNMIIEAEIYISEAQLIECDSEVNYIMETEEVIRD